MPLVLNRKPNVTLRRDLVNEFKQRSTLQQFVTDLVLDKSQEMKKLSVVDLRVTQNVPESVSQRSLHLE